MDLAGWSWRWGAHLMITTMILVIQATAVVTNNIVAEESPGLAITHTWVQIPAFEICKT